MSFAANPRRSNEGGGSRRKNRRCAVWGGWRGVWGVGMSWGGHLRRRRQGSGGRLESQVAALRTAPTPRKGLTEVGSGRTLPGGMTKNGEGGDERRAIVFGGPV